MVDSSQPAGTAHDRLHDVKEKEIKDRVEKQLPLDPPNMRVALQEMSTELSRVVAERDEFKRMWLNVIDLREDVKKEAGEYWGLLKELPTDLQNVLEIMQDAERGLSGHKKNDSPRKQLSYAASVLKQLIRKIKEGGA